MPSPSNPPRRNSSKNFRCRQLQFKLPQKPLPEIYRDSFIRAVVGVPKNLQDKFYNLVNKSGKFFGHQQQNPLPNEALYFVENYIFI